MSVNIEQDLRDILAKIDKRLEKIEETLQKDVTEIKIELATVKTKVENLEEKVKEIAGSQKAQIWTLIGIVGTALLGTVARYWFFKGNP